MFLVDTNVWLERLLDQERSGEVEDFLTRIPTDQLAITDFTVHSIGVILLRFKQADAFLSFVRDLFLDGSVRLIQLDAAEMPRLAELAEQFALDFDDAYQYAAAEQNGLALVSFDTDFDRTAMGRTAPGLATIDG
ncbi:MAG: PIN domain-containing protein [Dehalococcoidia bacterium]